MCYSIQVSPKTWSQSRDDCKQRQSELIKLSSTEELNYVYNTFIRPLHGKSSWIGLTKIDQHFQWVDGSNLTFKNWNIGEPNNSGGNEKCVELFVHSGKWNDITCSKLRPFLCKKGKKGVFRELSDRQTDRGADRQTDRQAYFDIFPETLLS